MLEATHNVLILMKNCLKRAEAPSSTRTGGQVEALRKALSSAERANESLQEDNRQSAEKFREMADKVYALMDALRLNQVRRTPIMV